MLNLINDRLSRRVFDDVMEVAWSTMWNVTDETAKNCERFLDGRGMEYFLGCLKVCKKVYLHLIFFVFTFNFYFLFPSFAAVSRSGRPVAQHDGSAGQRGGGEGATATPDDDRVHNRVFRSARLVQRRY